MDKLAASASADAQRAETAAQVVAAATVVALPQLPADLEKCLKRSLRPRQAKSEQGQSADALVIAQQKLKRDRELCAYQLLKWHEEQRAKAQPQVAAKK